MKTKFTVKGMTCSACASGIEKNLNRIDGVEVVGVSLMSESMYVVYDEGKVDSDVIIKSVNKLGYKAYPFETDTIDVKPTENLFIRFIVSLCLLLPLMYFSMGKMLGFPLPDNTVNYALQLSLTVIILIVNRSFFINGTRAVINKSANMDTLVALSAGGSFLYSLVASVLYFCGQSFTEHMFYESAAMVVTLVTLGKWLEDKSKKRTGKEIEKLSKLVPKTVTVLKDGKEVIVDTSSVVAGDILLFRMGDYVAVDGKVSSGLAFIDKAAITGESLPIEVCADAYVVSGSIVKSGYVEVIAEQVGEDTLFSKIIETVRTAGASKAPVQRFADKVAGIFVPVVVALALITFVVWISVTADVYRSVNFALSVLVISCPCALGLATPVVVMATTGKAASLGILYKDAEAIQRAQSINCVLLDKTATLTEGKPTVVDAVFYENAERLRSVASAIESKSTHPLAVCIREYCGVSNLICDSYDYVSGKGAVAQIDGETYYLGNDKLAKNVDRAVVTNLQSSYAEKGYTTVYLSDEKILLAVFAISDRIKQDSVEAVDALKRHNVQTVMVTGDNKAAARTIAEEVKIAEFVAEVLPNGKVDVVKRYQADGKYVAMVGDGINDSPAIKSADVGIAVGTGTDIAIDSADIVIVRGSLKGIIDSIRLSKKSNQIAKGNLFWAFFYNVITIPVAAGCLSTLGLVLTPSIAAACMCLSSLFVVTNALRVSSFKSEFKKAENTVSFEPLGDNLHRLEETVNNTSKGEDMNTTVYVDGMMCAHCVKHVKDALMQIEGVHKVEIDLDSRKVDISSEKPLNEKDINNAVTTAGYTVIDKK